MNRAVVPLDHNIVDNLNSRYSHLARQEGVVGFGISTNTQGYVIYFHIAKDSKELKTKLREQVDDPRVQVEFQVTPRRPRGFTGFPIF